MTLESSVLMFLKIMAVVFVFFLSLGAMAFSFAVQEEGLAHSWKEIVSFFSNLSQTDFAELWSKGIRPGLFWCLLLSSSLWFAVTVFTGGLTIIEVITGLNASKVSDIIFKVFLTLMILVFAWSFLSSQYKKHLKKR